VQIKKIIPGRKRRHLFRGLTVVEFIIVMAAIGIVVLISVPGATYLLEKHRLKTTSNQLVDGMDLARLEAQLRNSTVIVCPSSNGHSCRRDHDWNYGWVVFTDGNGNGTVQDIELLKSFGAPHERIRIEATGATLSRAAFTATGLVVDPEFHNGKFKICVENSSAEPRIVKVEEDGWVQLTAPQGEVCEAG
jgi:type IV fimbrial biogenesis protein FimT